MKILMICKSLPTQFKGGIQTHVWELSGALVTAGMQVSILTGGSFRQKTRREVQEGREIIYLPFLPGRRSPWLGDMLEELSFNLAARRWVKVHHRDFDIIHLQGRSGYLIPGLGISTPIVSTVHRLWAVESKFGSDGFKNRLEAGVFKRLTCWLEEKAIKKAKAVIAVSQSTIQEMTACLGISSRNIHLVYNGANERMISLPASPVKKQLLFVGRLCRIKGVFPLVEAMAEMEPGIQLIMIGDGPARPALLHLIKEKGLQDSVRLLGSQDQEVVRRLMRESYALILPSFHESQGIVLLENNIEGRPVLASAVAGIKEVVQHGHNGLLFSGPFVKDIITTIKTLLADPEAAAEMGRRGRESVKKHFNWEGIARQTIQIYTQL